MSNIVLIPIDNRPVCYQLPRLIIETAQEHNLFMPDISLTGSLDKAAKADKILDWLEGLENIDAIAVSLDTIAYGGLIPSRRSTEKKIDILKRIDRFYSIIKKLKARVFAFSSIMRISDNNINEEEKEYWREWGRKIFQYSYSIHKYGQAENDIPALILEDYMNTRNRNFEINKYYIELMRKGAFETLVFSKDDCAEYGLNIMEAQELKSLSAGIEDIYFKTGADEIPLTLLSRALNQSKRIKMHPVYTYPESIDKISKYEDISVKDSVCSQIEAAGGIVSNENDCDIILLVNNFKDTQGELVFGIETPLFQGRLKIPEKPFCAADILNANGADNNFAQQLLNSDLKNFFGYAGWNTTGNTLGSVISAALIYFGAQKPSKKAFNLLQAARFLDDFGYQANVRGLIRNNAENLTGDAVKAYMKKFEKIVSAKFQTVNEPEYYFPWGRFFEIGINF